jgi:hypothetical protein
MVENIKSVEAEQDGVEAVLKALRNAEAMHEKLVAQEQKARARCEAVKSRAKGSRSKRLTNAVLLARQRREHLTRQRGEARAELREARKMLREQQQLSREAQRKERAKERAVGGFLKRWERDYDREMKRKRKNVNLRKDTMREEWG